MSQLYRLTAEAAGSGDCREFLQVAVATGRRLPNAAKPWRGFTRDGVVEHATGSDGAALAGLVLASAVTERSEGLGR